VPENAEIVREILCPVEPEELWEVLTDPEQLREWFATEVELDPRPGGRGRFRWENGEERCATVREAEAPERLVLDWDDEGCVELVLEPDEDGTRLLVRETSADFGAALELRALAWTTA
jgi:uncharacterized protein YndB with AHSA1/START domain